MINCTTTLLMIDDIFNATFLQIVLYMLIQITCIQNQTAIGFGQFDKYSTNIVSSNHEVVVLLQPSPKMKSSYSNVNNIVR